MMIRMFQIDAFTDRVFHGNPAAVCTLATWLPDDTLQAIAAENNLSETAFYVYTPEGYELRWFTPTTEVDLCGHATLATAWVLVNEFDVKKQPLRFHTRSGELQVTHNDNGMFTLNFPCQSYRPYMAPAELKQALGTIIKSCWIAEDILVEVESEADVAALTPDFAKFIGLPGRGVILTAMGNDVDFVSRWFGPKVGVLEDPVTGSAHTLLTPFWSGRLGKTTLTAKQISKRGGELTCQLTEDRVLLSGQAVKAVEGFFTLPEEQ